jgi:hypothetical protein
MEADKLNFYNRTEEDKLSCINRCYFEADHGNIYDALERIKDLQQEFPDDPKVIFTEAQLREDFLGQGVAETARSCDSYGERRRARACHGRQ